MSVSENEVLDKVVDALAFAADAHRMQRRKDPEETPYINHPVALLRILAIEASVRDGDVLAAALLHDYLEDCCGPHQEGIVEGRSTLLRRFGDQVLKHVDAVTDDKTLPKAERKRQQVARAKNATHEAKLVKLADKIANLRDIASNPPGDWSRERKLEYFDWAAEVVDEMRGTHPVLEALFDAAYETRGRVESESDRTSS